MTTTYVLLSLFLVLAIEAVFAIPTGLHENMKHKITKRNFVPNRFDIVDNEIKHAIQKEVQNALRKNFVPNNPLLEANKWGRSSPARYPENQPTKIYGLEYDQINPSRSDPGYLVLDLKKLAQGSLKFHEQQIGGRKKNPKPNAASKPQQQNPTYNNQGQYQYQQYYNNGYQQNNQNYQQQNNQNYQQQNDQYYQQQNYQPQYGIQG